MQDLDFSYNDTTTDPNTRHQPDDGSVGSLTSAYDQAFGGSSSTRNAPPLSNPAAQNDNGGSQQSTGPNVSAPTDYNAGGQPMYTPPPASPTAAPAASPYTGLMSQIKQTTDPSQKAVLQDQLARTVYSTLGDAGHDVQWDGDQLMVDGRAYAMGDGSSATPPIANTGAGPGGQPATSSGQPGQYASALQGFDATKLADPNKHDPKYDFARIAQNYPPTPAGLQALAQDPAFAAAGYKLVGNDKIQVPNGSVIDVGLSFGSGGGVGWAWQPSSGPDAQQSPGAPGPASIPGFSLPNIAGGVSGAALANAAPPPAAAPVPGFQVTAPKYTPGAITSDDIPNLSYDQLLGDATVNDGTTQGTDALVQNILQNPESLDPQTVAEMKAKSKDDLSQMQADRDQQIKEMGASYGISDSPWEASQRLSALRDYDAQLVSGNRTIDTQAATQNAADKRSAAQVGVSADAQKTQAKQAAVQLASNGSLQAAAARGDRMALREQVNQAATQLGLSSDQLMLQYTQALIQQASQKYGVDVGASVDMSKLAESGREFQENLAFQLAQLGQNDAQFGASLGLQTADLQDRMNQEAYSNYTNTFS